MSKRTPQQPETPDLPGALEASGTDKPRKRIGGSHPALRYTLYRVGLFGVVFGAVWLLFRYALNLGGQGAGILAIGVALAISGVVSYFLLNSERDAMSAALVERVERAKARIEEGASAEDDVIADITPTPRTNDAI